MYLYYFEEKSIELYLVTINGFFGNNFFDASAHSISFYKDLFTVYVCCIQDCWSMPLPPKFYFLFCVRFQAIIFHSEGPQPCVLWPCLKKLHDFYKHLKIFLIWPLMPKNTKYVFLQCKFLVSKKSINDS